MKEAIRIIPGFKGIYAVTNKGRVVTVGRKLADGRTIKTRFLSAKVNPGNKYLRVRLNIDGGNKNFYVHRLVAITFIGQIYKGHEVNHIDGDCVNNSVANLEIITSRENRIHAINILGDGQKGSKNYSSKLTEEEVVDIRANNNGLLQYELAKKYCVSRSIISRIVNNKIWTHIDTR